MTAAPTVYPFTPNVSSPFQFQPTLDGITYTVLVTWNVTAQRYYLNLYGLDGARVATIALVGSPSDSDINLVQGYFTASTLVFRQDSQQFEVLP